MWFEDVENSAKQAADIGGEDGAFFQKYFSNIASELRTFYAELQLLQNHYGQILNESAKKTALYAKTHGLL